jgi:S-adenosylmethionine hydrolase
MTLPAVYQGLLAGLEDRLQRIERPPVITLTTDFGTHDGYTGTMKGVILALLPDAQVVDISHEIAPQQIHEGAFILYRAYRYFPASAVHVAVVDPGVGTQRRPIVLLTRHGTFVGPDNGIFTYVLRAEQAVSENPEIADRPAWVGGMWGVAPNWAGDEGRGGHKPDDSGDAVYATRSGELPRAYHLTNPDYWLPGVSTTFHGRDIFAPVAAHLASGAGPDRMGKPISLNSLIKLPVRAPRIYRTAQGVTVTGQVIYVDRFGDIITNLPQQLLAPLLESARSVPVIEVGDHRIAGLSASYADVQEGQPVALIGSEKLLEIAVRNANAAQRMKVRIGDVVRIIFVSGD